MKSSLSWYSILIRKALYAGALWSLVTLFAAFAPAQTPASKGPGAAKSAAPKAGAAKAAPTPALSRTTPATLAQLMKGIFFPNSNVIFAAQSDNPNDVKPAPDPSVSTNPLASTYGKWEAVENSSLAIAEAASLLSTPGRKCSNGMRSSVVRFIF